MNVLIVDGLNLIRRVHAAVLSSDREPDQQTVVNSCSGSLRKVLKRQQPSHAMCVMDSALPSWRHAEYPAYKANRKPMDEQLKAQLPAILDAFASLGVQNLVRDSFEADDVVASIAIKVKQASGESTIVSTDKSFCQLIQDGIHIYDHFSNRNLDRHYVEKRFETGPEHLATLFGLAGDKGLNVPGVQSIGVHTAAKLIRDHGSMEKILAASADMPGHVGAKLRAGIDDARQAMRLLTLRTDIELGLNLKDFRYSSDSAN
jgi:protein Xni